MPVSLFCRLPVFFGRFFTFLPLFLLGCSDIGSLDNEPIETVVADPSCLEMGSVISQPEFEWKIPVRNPTSQPLEMNITASCGCTKVDPSSLLLPPKTQKDVHLKLNLVSESDIASSRSEREFGVRLNFKYRVDGGAFRTESRELHAKVKGVLWATPKTLDFGVVHRSNVSKVTKTVELEMDDQVIDVAAVSTSGILKVSVVNSKPKGAVRLEFSQDAPVGRHKIEVPISCRLRNTPNRSITVTRVTATIEVIDDIYLDLRGGHLGFAKVGQEQEWASSLKSFNGSQFRVLSIATNNPDISVSTSSVAQGSATLRIKATPQTSGVVNARLTCRCALESDLSHQVSFEIPISFIAYKFSSVQDNPQGKKST